MNAPAAAVVSVTKVSRSHRREDGGASERAEDEDAAWRRWGRTIDLVAAEHTFWERREPRKRILGFMEKTIQKEDQS